jgi:hypothetical protein
MRQLTTQTGSPRTIYRQSHVYSYLEHRDRSRTLAHQTLTTYRSDKMSPTSLVGTCRCPAWSTLSPPSMVLVSAQVDLCRTYTACLATKDWDRLRTLLHPDVKLTFLPKSFGAPTISGAEELVKTAQKFMGNADEMRYELQDTIEEEGRVWYFVRLPSFLR